MEVGSQILAANPKQEAFYFFVIVCEQNHSLGPKPKSQMANNFGPVQFQVFQNLCSCKTVVSDTETIVSFIPFFYFWFSIIFGDIVTKIFRNLCLHFARRWAEKMGKYQKRKYGMKETK